MLELGFALSSEDHAPNELVRQAVVAKHAGFTFAPVSDHFHPWVDAQGESPFVWSTLGGIDVAESTPHGPDPAGYLEQIRSFEDAGFTHVYIHQIGDNQDEFVEFVARELMPSLKLEPASARA